jgi:hypothetical protein
MYKLSSPRCSFRLTNQEDHNVKRNGSRSSFPQPTERRERLYNLEMGVKTPCGPHRVRSLVLLFTCECVTKGDLSALPDSKRGSNQ